MDEERTKVVEFLIGSPSDKVDFIQKCLNEASKNKIDKLNSQLRAANNTISKLENNQNNINMNTSSIFEANSNQGNLQAVQTISNADIESLMSHIQRAYKGSLWTNSTFYTLREDQQNDELELNEDTTEQLVNNFNPDQEQLERSETVKFYKIKSANDKLYSLNIATAEPETQNQYVEDFLIQFYRLTMEINNKVEELKTESGMVRIRDSTERMQLVYNMFEKKMEDTLFSFLNDFKVKYNKDIEKVKQEIKYIQTEYAQKNVILEEEKKKNDEEINSFREKTQMVEEENKMLNRIVDNQKKIINNLNEEISVYLD